MNFLIPNLLQARLLLLVLVSWTLDSSAQFEAPDPKCQNSRAGLPACSFDVSKCFHEDLGVKPAWKLVRPVEKGPVERHIATYVYLDPVESQGNPRPMKALIARGKKAICVEFYYATAGNGTAPIDISIENGDKFSVMHHVDANTRGSWKSSRFSCCLPHVEGTRQIAIEASSSEDAIVAIDQMDIHASDMPCENGLLACYPFQAPLEPDDSSPSCPAEDAATNRLSCDFTSATKDHPDTCSWHMSPGWVARQKYDGSGRYEVLSSTKQESVFLLSAVSGAVGSACIEIQFTLLNISVDVSNAFTIDIQEYQGDIVFSGQAYNYDGSSLTVWKRNTFSTCLPRGQSWQMKITSNVIGLQLDNVHVRISPTPECESTTVANADTSVLVLETSTIHQTTEDILAVENRESKDSRSGSTTMGTTTVFSVVALLCLIMLVSLTAVAWEMVKRRQARLPLWPFSSVA